MYILISMIECEFIYIYIYIYIPTITILWGIDRDRQIDNIYIYIKIFEMNTPIKIYVCVCLFLYKIVYSLILNIYLYIYIYIYICYIKPKRKSPLPGWRHNVPDVQQEVTLALYLFIICQDYTLGTSIDIMKDDSFNLAKEISRRYPAQTITDVDYTDDIELLANTRAQPETLLHGLERAVAGIGIHVNADKTEYRYFNQRGGISTLNGSSLKLVDKSTYLVSSVSSTKKDVNTRLG